MSVAREKPVAGSSGSRRFAGYKRWAVLSLLAASLVLLFFVLDFVVTHPTGTLDFVNLYTAGTILKNGSAKNLYDLPLQRKIESRIAPGGQFLPFDHLPFEAFLFTPLARLPLAPAFLVWAGVNLLLLALIFVFLPRTGVRLEQDNRLVWLAVSFPLVGGSLVLGQDSLLLVPIFLFAFLALKKRHEFVAGMVLGLGLFRFEIVLPFIFIFFLRRRWNVLAGFMVASAAALLASLGSVGWAGLVEYWRLLLAVGRTTGSQANGVTTAAMPSLRGAVATFWGGVLPSAALFPVVLAGTLLLLFWASWQFGHVPDPLNPSFDLEFSLATLAALLASYHLFVHELTPLIVVAFLLLGYEDVAKRGERLLKRPGTLLLLLFALVLIVGEMVGFHSFSVLFIVLLGLMVWLSQEIGDGREAHRVG